ncbi:MAG: hypothetical protein IPN62_08750 [Flavobacteriales bacterium]|nr:hypothetical protein [Flavobacteriales bacterium]
MTNKTTNAPTGISALDIATLCQGHDPGKHRKQDADTEGQVGQVESGIDA